MVIYVDDFKMAGPKDNVANAFAKLRTKGTVEGIEMDDPKEADHYLGCKHIIGEANTKDGTTVRTLTYDMKGFMQSCIDLYKELAGPDFVLKKVGTPFIDEDDTENPHGNLSATAKR